MKKNLSKEELVELIEKAELKRINKLTKEQFFIEYSEWFMLTEEEAKEDKSKKHIELLNNYMEDFMNWKTQYSIEELEETLEAYSNN